MARSPDDLIHRPTAPAHPINRPLSLLAIAALLPLASCRSPLAVLGDDASCVQVDGAFDARAPEYIVMYDEGVPAAQTTDLLAAKYDFTVTRRYDAVGGFFAVSLTDAQVEGIRCEAVVHAMSRNSLVTAGA